MFVSKKTKERAAKFGRGGLLGDRPSNDVSSSGQREESFSSIRRGSTLGNNDQPNNRRGFFDQSNRSGGSQDQQFGSQREGSQNQGRDSYRGEIRGGTFGSDKSLYLDSQGKGDLYSGRKREGGSSYRGSQSRGDNFNRDEDSYFSAQKSSTSSRSNLYGSGNSRDADSLRRGNASIMGSRGASSSNMDFGKDNDSYRDQGRGQQRNDNSWNQLQQRNNNSGNQWQQRNNNFGNQWQQRNDNSENQRQRNQDNRSNQRGNTSYDNQHQRNWDRYNNQQRDNAPYNDQRQGNMDRYDNQRRGNTSYNDRQERDNAPYTSQQRGGSNFSSNQGSRDHYGGREREYGDRYDSAFYDNQQQSGRDRYNDQQKNDPPYNQQQGSWNPYNNQQRDNAPYNDQRQGSMDRYDNQRRGNISYNDRQERNNAPSTSQQRGGSNFYSNQGSRDYYEDREREYGDRYGDHQRGKNSSYNEQHRSNNASFEDQHRRGRYNSNTNHQRGDNTSRIDQERRGTKSFMQQQQTQRGHDSSYEGMGMTQDDDDSKEPTQSETMAALGILQKVLAKKQLPPAQTPAPPSQPQSNFQGFREEFNMDHSRPNQPSFGGSTHRMRPTRFTSPEPLEPRPKITDWSHRSRFDSSSATAVDVLTVMDNLQNLLPAAVSTMPSPGRHLLDDTLNSVNIDDFRIRDQSLHKSLNKQIASRKRQLEVIGLPVQKRSRTSVLSRLGPKNDVLYRITQKKGDVKSRISRKGLQKEDLSQSPGKLPISERLGPRKKASISGGDGDEGKMDIVEMKKLAAKYSDFPRKWLQCHVCKLKYFRGPFEFLVHRQSEKHMKRENFVKKKADATQNYLVKAAQYAFALGTQDREVQLDDDRCDVCDVSVNVDGINHKSIVKECKLLHQYIGRFQCSCGKSISNRMFYEKHCLTFLHMKREQTAKMQKLENNKEEEKLNELKEIFKTGRKEDEEGKPLKIEFNNATFEKEALIYKEFGEERVPREIFSLLKLYKNEERTHGNSPDKKEGNLQPYDPSHTCGPHNINFVTDPYCVLCKTTIKNSKESILEHCSTKEHYKKVMEKAEARIEQTKEQEEDGKKGIIEIEQKKVGNQVKSSSKGSAEEEDDDDNFSLTGNVIDDNELFDYSDAEEEAEKGEKRACEDKDVSVENSKNIKKAELNSEILKARKARFEKPTLEKQSKGTVNQDIAVELGSRRILTRGKGGPLVAKNTNTKTMEAASADNRENEDGGNHEVEEEEDRKDKSQPEFGVKDCEAVDPVEGGSGMDEGEADIAQFEESAEMMEVEEEADVRKFEEGTLTHTVQVDEGATMDEVQDGADMLAEVEGGADVVGEDEDGEEMVPEVEDGVDVVEVEDGAGMGEAEDEADFDEVGDDAIIEAEDESDLGEGEDDADVGEAEDEADIGEAEDDADVDEAEDDADVGEAEDEADIGEAEDDADVDEAEDDADVGEAEGVYMDEFEDKGNVSEDGNANENEYDIAEGDEEGFLVTEEQEGEEPVEVNLSEEEENEEIDLTAKEEEERKKSLEQRVSLRQRKNMFRF